MITIVMRTEAIVVNIKSSSYIPVLRKRDKKCCCRKENVMVLCLSYLPTYLPIAFTPLLVKLHQIELT